MIIPSLPTPSAGAVAGGDATDFLLPPRAV